MDQATQFFHEATMLIASLGKDEDEDIRLGKMLDDIELKASITQADTAEDALFQLRLFSAVNFDDCDKRDQRLLVSVAKFLAKDISKNKEFNVTGDFYGLPVGKVVGSNS